MILETQDIVKRFGGLTAVDHVSIGVEEGEIFGLIGPNGAGKTTLLNVIAGVYSPTAGTVHFAGECTSGLPPESICKKGLSRTFQICRPFPDMTALENVMVAAIFGHAEGTVEEPAKMAEDRLQFVEFPMPVGTLAKQLNAGQLKRLDLARALATGPKVLLLDEVGAGLTPGELADITKLIRKIRDAGTTIVIVEHLMRVILGICDRIAVLHYGQKIAEGTAEEIKGDERVAEAYLGEKYML